MDIEICEIRTNDYELFTSEEHYSLGVYKNGAN